LFLAHLRELHAEVQERGELLIRYEVPAVTREYAHQDVGLHPLVCLLEEAHVAIQHPTYGGEVSKLLVDIVRLGRKRGIHLIVSTQAPTKDEDRLARLIAWQSSVRRGWNRWGPPPPQ
jgi:DNA segregation ATPase FtsK/SpoIIIE, S-DNA-T family